MRRPGLQSVFGDHYQPDVEMDRPPPPGRQALLLALLVVGFLLMGIQLWLLALISGGVFLGGMLALRLAREPQPRP